MSGKSWTRGRMAALSVVALTMLSACGRPFSSEGDTNVRLRNASSFELTAVTFRPGQAELKFARIAPGAATGYVPVASAYRYGYLDALVDGERRVLQPIDYVGESVIGAGRFTYVITVDPTSRQPNVTLVED